MPRRLSQRLATAIHHLEARGQLRHPLHEYEARLQREIDIIKQMKYAGYFLIVWTSFAMRGSWGFRWVRAWLGGGSLVAYVMEITNIDPIQNVLLFERFLNPERVSMPDIDVDFCMNRRGEVIEYVTRKYGREQVAQIITFNTMAARPRSRIADAPWICLWRCGSHCQADSGDDRYHHRQGS